MGGPASGPANHLYVFVCRSAKKFRLRRWYWLPLSAVSLYAPRDPLFAHSPAYMHVSSNRLSQFTSSVISYQIMQKKGFGRVDHFLNSKQ